MPNGAKRWTFTINNPTDADKFWCVDGDEQHPNDVLVNIQYFVLQEEEGETTHTRHWQGFIILKDKHDLSWLSRRINKRAHWEVARGTDKQASEYCKKEDTRVPGGLQKEFGTLPNREPVKKRDERLQEAAEELDIIKEGYKRPAEIPSMTLMQCGFLSAYKELVADILGPYRPNLTIITLVGPPGTGKSYAINKMFPIHGRCIMGNNGVWYQNPLSKVMVWEEFCGQIQLQRMLQFLDPYPLALEIKGGMRPAMYEIAIITSNTRPDGWYKGEEAGEPGKRTDAIKALWDRLGFSNGSYIPVRTCGHYFQCPDGLTILQSRDWFAKQLNQFTAEPISDSEDGFGSPCGDTEDTAPDGDIASYMIDDTSDNE